MSTQFTNRQWRLPNNENKDKQSNYSMYIDKTPYIKSSLSVDELNEITISFWFKTSISNQSDGVLIAFPESTTGTGLDISLQYSSPNEKIRFNTYTHSSNNRVEANFNYSDNNWHHLICSYNGSVHNIYIDGVLKASESASGTLKNAQNEFFIGAFNTTYPSLRADNTFFDQVCVFNYPLSDGGVSVGQTATGQIATLYGGGSAIGNPMSLSPAPVAYYPLGDQDAFNGAEYLTPNASMKDFVFDFENSSNQYISGTASLPNTDYTISAWINLETVTSESIVSWGEDATGKRRALFIWNGGAGAYRLYSSTYGSNIGGSTTLLTGQWYHAAVTVSSAAVAKIYLNGSLDGTGTNTLNSFTGTNFYIGRTFSGEYFDGKISNAQIFNTVLPATGSNSIETLYNNGSPLTSMSGFTSLQGWWKLDASATYDGTDWTIPDDSSNSNDGTSSGMTQANLVQSDLSFTSGYSPYALDFDGTNDRIISGSNSGFTSNDARTFSAWIKSTDSSGSNKTIIQTGPDGTCNGNFELSIHQGKLMFNTWASCGSGYSKSGANVITDGNWHHIVITYDGSNMNGYLDGSLAGGDFPVSSVTTSTLNTPYYIGGSATGSYSKEFNGSISNVSVWNAALTSSQVTEIYSEGVPQNLNNHSAYSNLVSWWQLGSNSSFNTNWTVLDEKGSNNGTSVNMTEVDIVDGVGSYANGLSSGMGGDEVIGDAPYSSSNSLSVNMDVEDRTTDTPS